VELSDAEFDKQTGRMNDLQYGAIALSLARIDARIGEIDASILSIERSMESLVGASWLDELPDLLRVPDALASRSLQASQGALLRDDALLAQLLEADPSYRSARREVREVALDERMGMASQASMLSVSMQISPSYTPSDGASFLDSFGELFSQGSPVLAVSVSLSAPDLGGKGDRLFNDTLAQRRLQASNSLEQAGNEVRLRLFALQDAIDANLASLALALDAYELAVSDLEVEQVRYDAGLSGLAAVDRRSRAVYQSAFAVFSVLRNLELTWLELESMK
jgi:outer membrane protein TolC